MDYKTKKSLTVTPSNSIKKDSNNYNNNNLDNNLEKKAYSCVLNI